MAESTRQTAQRLAKHGRYGDTMLLHVSPLEVAGIASLVPGGLTTNPDTGLPEAFFFLPFLASLFSAAAPAAAAATAAAPALAGAGLASGLAAGAGTAAGLTAATAAPVAAAAPSFLGSLGSGISSLFGGAGANALAGGAAGDVIAPAAAAAAPAAAAGPAETAAFATHAATVGPFAGGAGAAPYTPAITAAPAAPIIPGAGAYTAATGPLPEVTAAIPAVRPEVATATSGGIGGLLNTDTLMKGLIGVQMLKGLLSSSGGGGSDKAKPGAGKERHSDDELRYRFDKSIPNLSTVDRGEFNFRPGFVRGYAQGGIVDLPSAGQSGVDSQMQQPQDMSMPLNGVDNGQPMAEIPQSPYPSSQIGSPYDPSNTVVAPSGNDKELIAMTIAAISGKVPNPEPIILAFIKNFGEQAFQDLVAKFKGMGGQGQSVPNDGRLVRGPGTGTSDSIPAMINGTQPAALSDGEYVVPAQAVQNIGGGDTNQGAARLDQMVKAAKGGLISLRV